MLPPHGGRAAAIFFLTSAQIIADPSDDKEIVFRESFSRPSYEASYWYLMLSDPSLNEECSFSATRFRRRFGVPFGIYLDILIKAKAWFPLKRNDAFRRPSIPIELKVLASLRVIAKGWSMELRNCVICTKVRCKHGITSLFQNLFRKSVSSG